MIHVVGAELTAVRETRLVNEPVHWSFRPVKRPRVPQVDTGWVRNPIDAFLAVRHQELGLVPLETAPPHILIRRLYVDLVGVPPTPAELEEFIAQPTDDRYERIVDRLLDDPRHGERWGRHWMDVWRYSDWAGHGAEVRESQPHIWRWRDWIMESVHADKPYDRMIVEMLAADEVAPLDADALRATGFLVRNWFRYNRNVWLEASVEHTGKAFLGLTLNCAKCHDSKSDPLSQVDFYRMRAFFEPHDIRTNVLSLEGGVPTNSLVQVYDARLTEPTYVFTRGDEARPETNHLVLPQFPGFMEGLSKPISPIPLPVESYYPALSDGAVKVALAASENEVRAAEEKAEASWAAVLAATNSVETLRMTAEVATRRSGVTRARQIALRQRIVAERVKHGVIPGDAETCARAAAGAERQANVAAAELALAEAAGAVHKLRSLQKEDVPKSNPEPGSKPDANADDKAQKALLDAEKKVAEAQETLSAARRAAVEPSTQYAALGPVYPKMSTGRRLLLARWIADADNPLTARVAVNHLWMRHLGSPLVATVFDFGRAGKPPTHPELLDWLASEFVRQGWSMKAMHRLIVTSSAYRMNSSGGAMMAGNLAKDRDNIQLWRMNVRRAEAEVVRDSILHAAGVLDRTMGGPELDHALGETSLRRSVYFRHAKEKWMEFTQTFDGPGVSECYRRDESIVPQQALALANSVLIKNQSRRLAGTIQASLGTDQGDERFIDAAFVGILSRSPTPEESKACREFLREQTQLLSEPSRLTPARVGVSSQVAPSTDPRLRARENLVVVIFNHNDFVSIR